MSSKLALDACAIARSRQFRIAIAVSGGSDSVALMQLAHEADIDFQVVSVDHGLRDAARDELDLVRARADALGVSHHIVRVVVPRDGNLMAMARNARYEALASWAQTRDIDEIWLGHTLDDQAEGFWLRAYRGSGVSGLGPMDTAFTRDRIQFYRPLLNFDREALQDYLRAMGIGWCSDPTNSDQSFDRARMRPIVKSAADNGFSNAQLQRTMANMTRVERMIARMIGEFVLSHMIIKPLNIEIEIDKPAFLALDEEIALRILSDVTRYYAMADYPPRLHTLQGILAQLPNAKGGATIGGAEWQWSERKIKVYPEYRALPLPAKGRWYLFTRSESDEGGVISPLGDDRRIVSDWQEWRITARAARSLPVHRAQSGELRALFLDDKWQVAPLPWG